MQLSAVSQDILSPYLRTEVFPGSPSTFECEHADSCHLCLFPSALNKSIKQCKITHLQQLMLTLNVTPCSQNSKWICWK